MEYFSILSLALFSGIMGWAAHGLWRRRQGRRPEGSPEDACGIPAPAAVVPPPSAATTDRFNMSLAMVEPGASEPILRSLGCRLREAIRCHAVTPELLAAAEWSLDRHHVRAIQHLSAGFGDDADLHEDLERLRNGDGNGRARLPAPLQDRLGRIVYAIARDRVQQRLGPAGSLPEQWPRGCVDAEFIRHLADRAVGSRASVRPGGHQETAS